MRPRATPLEDGLARGATERCALYLGYENTTSIHIDEKRAPRFVLRAWWIQVAALIRRHQVRLKRTVTKQPVAPAAEKLFDLAVHLPTTSHRAMRSWVRPHTALISVAQIALSIEMCR